jgi:replicative DNA helicase
VAPRRALLRIPACYLRASEAQRRALLAGILDVGGAVAVNGSVQLAASSRQLAEDVRELVLSLGYLCAMSARPVKGRTGAAPVCGYLVSFATEDQVFLLSSKQHLHKERLGRYPRHARWRSIVDVRRVPSRPVRCVQVDSPDRMYLAGRGMIPTHNSTLALDLARAA